MNLVAFLRASGIDWASKFNDGAILSEFWLLLEWVFHPISPEFLAVFCKSSLMKNLGISPLIKGSMLQKYGGQKISLDVQVPEFSSL